MKRESLLREAASTTPDPKRAIHNLDRLFREAPEFIEAHEQFIGTIALLFAHSQFLSDYCISNPSRLTDALRDRYLPIRKENILRMADEIRDSFLEEQQTSLYRQYSMKLLRDLKKYFLLVITLRDICGITVLQECMAELSTLAESIVSSALELSFTLMRRRFGLVVQNAYSVIGMGKLGARELNYSSDIDIITVYQKGNGLSTGVLNPYGIRHNRISSHEYHCILTETFAGLLQTATQDGIAYRVDLRLRPNGQKGSLSLDLASYRSYYEAWGKTWERLALTRARFVAGDAHLADAFIRTVEPFVWRRSIDFNDIDEIRALKKKIDTISDVNDLKRGYGGIREIEFFVQTFQLLYGGERVKLRGGYLVTILDELHREGLISLGEANALSASYLFLRRIEHLLQMRDDIPTYTLPADPEEIKIICRKMKFVSEQDFLTQLKVTRFRVRDMYNTLLGGPDTTREILLSSLDELPDDALRDYLCIRGFRHPETALRNMRSLYEQISIGKTPRERNLLRRAIPPFLEQIMNTVEKDKALDHLVSFLSEIGHHESYIDLLAQRTDTREVIVDIFSTSSYFSRILLNADNLEGLFEYPDTRIDLRSLQDHLPEMFSRSADPLRTIRELKNAEELKYGMLFLKGHLDPYSFAHRLSMLADSIIRAIVAHLKAVRHFAIIGLGGYGARDLNIGSDLDLLFICSGDEIDHSTGSPQNAEKRAAEIIRYLSGYTEKGFAYKVDVRLRPDGSQGILVHRMDGYHSYYRCAAQPWEIQSLLRARPIAGDMNLLRNFLRLRKQVIIERGKEIRGKAVGEIRKRIVSEVSKESTGAYDIKNGPGGIKEIDFLIQYHQMKHAAEMPDLIVHNTIGACKRLSKYAILDKNIADFLLHSHSFLKSVDTLLRCNGEDVVRVDSELLEVMSRFLRISLPVHLTKRIAKTRRRVLEIAQKHYESGD